MVSVFYSPAYTVAAYAFDTTRKAAWIIKSLAGSPIGGVEVVAPEPLTAADISRVHDPAYVRAVETGNPRRLAESQGFEWDMGLWMAVLASNGGVVAAAHAAMKDGVAGSLSSGLHHARHSSGAGFCTFNGLVIAAREALAFGATSALILDLDAHCGGGTASLIQDEPHIQQIDVSVDRYDRYPDTKNSTLDLVDDAEAYLGTIEQRLTESGARRFDLCLYNAGMDPYEGCSIGGRRGITERMLAQREQLVFHWARQRGIPIAFVLAGGYIGSGLDERGLVDLHRLTLCAAAEAG